MSNPVHLIVTPTEGSNLSRAIGETHRRYTRYINFREGWRGYQESRTVAGQVNQRLTMKVTDSNIAPTNSFLNRSA